MDNKTLGEALPLEMARVRDDVMPAYQEVGAAGMCAVVAAIRALPLPEETPTPREKLRRVREARELLASARVARVPVGGESVFDEGTGQPIGGWRRYVAAWARPVDELTRWAPGSELRDARTWVLDTLRAEGWDVVEEE
jgi:hypothetical protein